ncbi:zinc finger CCCH domain-containing protein 3 isoform X4 [Phragmites australis]|uniref:zinc finger CCCH domain-containing protein 3 isoform X4 n=1 Tax=Phragmites australis TaxID=29695 RepID=UPI002D7653C8|nr:zinc finger CCCH domain-containing protein 3 isoform X4 [Phragmites australis]
MPLGKYYCDYCEKQFQDTAAARKRHLQGAQHKRARALWYDSIRHHDQHGGASTLLLPDGTLAKGICHHFVRTGTCKYGDSCRYIHPRSDAVSPALAASGPGPGAMVQQPNLLGSQPNFGGYQAPERNSFSELPEQFSKWNQWELCQTAFCSFQLSE